MNNDEKNRDSQEEPLELGPAESWPPTDRLFDDLEENEEFEEPDRDSDYATMFTEVDELEPDYPEDEDEDQPDRVTAEARLTPYEEEDIRSGEGWDNDDSESPQDPEPDEPSSEETWAALSSLSSERLDIEPLEEGAFDTEPMDDWEEETFDEDREFSLPLGMIVVTLVALVLLGAGGYGVMHDRASLQEEVRQLQARLATTASPAELAEALASAEMQASRNRDLEQQVADLSRENRSLQTIVAGLETQLKAQQEALAARPKAPEPRPEPKKATAKPATVQAASKPATGPVAGTPVAGTPVAGTWFVNFGSYSQRSAAESWAKRVEPDAGNVIVSEGQKDGRTFYRVRVVNLSGKDQANATARRLEQEHGLSRLWVGRSR